MKNRTATSIATRTRLYRHSVRLRPTVLRAVLVASVSLVALMACSSQPPQAIPAQTQTGACQTSQLAFSLDDGNGRFNGMSHSGTMLVLRNMAPAACTIPAMPQPAFASADGRTLDITAQDSAGPLGGPTAPLMLGPGASVASDMRWVSGNVYDNGHCESPAMVTLSIDEHTISTNFTGQMCGPGDKPPSYTLTPFQLIAARSTVPSTAKALVYTCDDGRIVQAIYPDAGTAMLTLDGQTHRLHTAISADGARYVGKHWQWWTKGMHEGQLAPLKPGETIASDQGVSCTAP